MVYLRSKQKIFDGQKALFILTIFITLVSVFHLIGPSPVIAQLYKLTDNKGTIHFTDTIYLLINEKGEVYYTNYIAFLPPEKYLATAKEIEPGSPPDEIKQLQSVWDSRDIMAKMKKSDD
jgi:hypothetical protein